MSLFCRQNDVDESDSTAEALLFITGLLVEGRATAEPQATLKVLRHLAQDPAAASEDSFVAVLQTATLQGGHPLPLCLPLRLPLPHLCNLPPVAAH